MSDKNQIKRFVTFVLGGRPMTCLGKLFYDPVEGKMVYWFIDRYGRSWMANHRWAKFRVEKPI